MKEIKVDENNRYKVDIGYTINKQLISEPCTIQIFQECKFSDKWMGVSSLIIPLKEYVEIIEKIGEMLQKE